MKNRYLLTGLLLASATVACGPRKSQWVVVTDCAEKHVVISEATVWVYEGITEDMAGGLGSAGLSARGGKTNAQGVTWASFPVEHKSVAEADMRTGGTRTKEERNPQTPVPAGAAEPVYVCVEKKNR